MVVTLGREDRAEERVIALIVRASEHADKVRLVVIGLAHLESEAVARGGVLDREQRVPGENELKRRVHTQSA